MATVTGMKAEKMIEIADASIVDGDVDASGNFVLITRGGTAIPAGNIKGPKGDVGPVGTIQASPAGGDLKGNFPNPQIADALKDADGGIASMRTLGPGVKQAAPGSSTADTGWVTFNPTVGETPFGSSADVLVMRYRKIGRMVNVQIRKALGSDLDRSGNTGGNFPNVRVIGDGSVPLIARPKGAGALGSASLADSPQGCVLTEAGSVVWSGGFPRLYRLGQSFNADFVFMTDN